MFHLAWSTTSNHLEDEELFVIYGDGFSKGSLKWDLNMTLRLRTIPQVATVGGEMWYSRSNTFNNRNNRLGQGPVVPVEFGNSLFGLEECMAAEQVRLCVLLLQRRTPQDLSSPLE